MTVTDGLDIRELHPNICLVAFMSECSKGQGKLLGSFTEKTLSANIYRAKLLGIMAIHLILLSVNRINPTLKGLVHIFSDCLGVLDQVEHLPPHRFPLRCKHSGILKNILINCSDLTSCHIFSHIKVHQDIENHFYALERESQMNCACDAGAKNGTWKLDPKDLQTQKVFPLEPACVFVRLERMTALNPVLES